MAQDFTLAQIQAAVPTVRWAELKEGDYATLNTVNIAKGAANPELAHQFINFILDPKIQQTLAEARRRRSGRDGGRADARGGVALDLRPEDDRARSGASTTRSSTRPRTTGSTPGAKSSGSNASHHGDRDVSGSPGRRTGWALTAPATLAVIGFLLVPIGGGHRRHVHGSARGLRALYRLFQQRLPHDRPVPHAADRGAHDDRSPSSSAS